MIECDVLSIAPIDVNTAVAVIGPREIFRNGMIVTDNNGKRFEVLSVGISGGFDLDKTALVLEGCFRSSKLWVE